MLFTFILLLDVALKKNIMKRLDLKAVVEWSMLSEFHVKHVYIMLIQNKLVCCLRIWRLLLLYCNNGYYITQ